MVRSLLRFLSLSSSVESKSFQPCVKKISFLEGVTSFLCFLYLWIASSASNIPDVIWLNSSISSEVLIPSSLKKFSMTFEPFDLFTLLYLNLSMASLYLFKVSESLSNPRFFSKSSISSSLYSSFNLLKTSLTLLSILSCNASGAKSVLSKSIHTVQKSWLVNCF